MWEDNGDVADFGHDRIGAVGSALPETTGMNMDVSDDGPPSFPTKPPEIAKLTTIDFDNAGA